VTVLKVKIFLQINNGEPFEWITYPLATPAPFKTLNKEMMKMGLHVQMWAVHPHMEVIGSHLSNNGYTIADARKRNPRIHT
jgi:hypothetical protein